MDRSQLTLELKEMIVAECDAEFGVEDIADDMRLIGEEGLQLDSLDGLQIALAVKERYGVRIEGGPDSRKAMESVSALADYILERRAGA
jgi:acyl carrier protein